MEFKEVVKNRISVRSFQNKEVEEEKLKEILGITNRAPSAGNLQAREIFIVRSKEKKKALARAAHDQDFVVKAPVLVVFCAHPKMSSWKYGERGKFYSILDAAIAASHFQLAVYDFGLATCWVGAFDDNEVLEILEAKEDLIPVAIMPVGYPAEKPQPTSRRSLSDILHEVK